MGRHEERGRFRRASEFAGQRQSALREPDGFDRGEMPRPAFRLLPKYFETIESESAQK